MGSSAGGSKVMAVKRVCRRLDLKDSSIHNEDLNTEGLHQVPKDTCCRPGKSKKPTIYSLAVLLFVDLLPQDTGRFKGNHSSGVEGEFLASLGISAPSGIFIFDVELAESAQQQIGATDQRLF